MSNQNPIGADDFAEREDAELQRNRAAVDQLRDLLEVILGLFHDDGHGNRVITQPVSKHAVRHWSKALTGGAYEPLRDYGLFLYLRDADSKNT